MAINRDGNQLFCSRSAARLLSLAIVSTLLISCADSPLAIPATNAGTSNMTQPFDYTEYTKLLKIYVDDAGMVDYATLQKNRALLDTLIADMGTLNPDTYAGWSKEAQFAFWINAYNAVTLKTIIDNYPIKKGGLIKRSLYPDNSIRQIDGVWKKKTTSIIGQDITLDEIEHKVLREQFGDPRMHFAIVCASMSCPPLRAEAFESDKLDAQLADQSHVFLSDKEKFRIDSNNEKIYLSPILDWFDEDFADHYNLDQAITGRSKRLGAVLDFVRTHLNDDHAVHITDSSFKIEYLDYDWSLNEQK